METNRLGQGTTGVARIGRWLSAAALLVVTLASTFAGGGSADAAAPSKYYVAETGHVLSEPVLSSWIAEDGMETLGLPVTEAKRTDGSITQYFELGQLHANSGTASSADLTRQPAGNDLLALQHQPERMVAGRRIGSAPNATAFAGTSTTTPKLAGRTKAYFDRHGGVARFGTPVSKEYIANGMRVQWFTHGRLQWSVVDKKVHAGAVGVELARARGINTAPVDRKGLPDFDPNRFRKFAGDGVVPNATESFNPVRIEIPKIAVNATVEQVGIVGGVMQVPTDAWNVGWYENLSSPGEWTNVVMAGHRDWWGVGPVVFWNLEQLVPGDKIYVLGADGKGSTYVVSESWQVPADVDANTIIKDTGGEVLTLITCGGTFNGSAYDSRHIVRAERI